MYIVRILDNEVRKTLNTAQLEFPQLAVARQVARTIPHMFPGAQVELLSVRDRRAISRLKLAKARNHRS